MSRFFQPRIFCFLRKEVPPRDLPGGQIGDRFIPGNVLPCPSSPRSIFYSVSGEARTERNVHAIKHLRPVARIRLTHSPPPNTRAAVSLLADHPGVRPGDRIQTTLQGLGDKRHHAAQLPLCVGGACQGVQVSRAMDEWKRERPENVIPLA
jgi:hypothetical protein